MMQWCAVRVRCQISALLILLAWSVIAVPAATADDKRVALVIGNSAYAHSQRLKNPINDARDMAAALEKVGFTVILGTDLDKVSMDRQIRDFARALQGAQVGLFFYAGHGLQVGGFNYLVPIDAKLEDASGLDFEMVRLDLVHRSMERESRTNLIFLDACRDNPLSRKLSRAMGTRSGDIGLGLAPVESGIGTMISFSTQPGNVALDGQERNSPYAAALVRGIGSPTDDISTILIGVRNSVMAVTDRRQVPWEHSSLTSKYYFTPPAPPPPPRPAGPTFEQQAELAFWDSVKDSREPAIVQTYIDSYPKGVFVALARVLIERLKTEAERNALLAKKESELARAEKSRALAQQQQADAERKTLEEQRAGREAQRDEQLSRAQLELKKAQEAVKSAEAARLSAQKAAEEARVAATAAKAATEGEVKKDGRSVVASLPTAPPPGRFDGTWTFTRSITARCGANSAVFTVRILGGVVTGPGGRGRLSDSGDVYVPGSANNFRGKLNGNSGSGSYSGRCEGTFTAQRR